MAITKSTVKVPLGMRVSWFFPIKSEAAGTAPVYDAAIDMGHAVKGYLTITTATCEIPGDDAIQARAEKFVSGQLDAETTMSDLEVNAKIFGHKYTEEEGEVSSSDDAAPDGGYGFVEPILNKNKKLSYRATFLHKVTAMASSEKQEADTRKPGEFTFKNYAVSYMVQVDNANNWRSRDDFESLQEATAYIERKAGQAT